MADSYIRRMTVIESILSIVDEPVSNGGLGSNPVAPRGTPRKTNGSSVLHNDAASDSEVDNLPRSFGNFMQKSPLRVLSASK